MGSEICISDSDKPDVGEPESSIGGKDLLLSIAIFLSINSRLLTEKRREGIVDAASVRNARRNSSASAECTGFEFDEIDDSCSFMAVILITLAIQV